MVGGPGARGDAVIPGSPLTIYADDNGQLQVDVQRQPDRRVLPAVAARRRTRGSTSRIPAGDRTPRPSRSSASRARAFTPDTVPRRSRATAAPGNPWVLSATLPRPTRPSANRVDPRRRDGHLRQRDHGRRAFVLRRVPDAIPTAPLQRAPLRGRRPLRVRQRRRRRVPRRRAAAAGRRDQPGAGQLRPARRADAVGRITRRGGTATSSPRQRHRARRRGLQRHDRPDAPRQRGRRAVGLPNTRRRVTPRTSPVDLALQALHPAARSTPRGGREAQGQIATVTVTARNSDGNPDPGRAVRYAIDGANPGIGAVTTGRRRQRGDHAGPAPTPGTDTLTAFTDLNGNGVPRRRRARADATVTSGPRRRRRCPASRWS